LPQGQAAQDSIADSRDFAYYQLGVLYKEKFKRQDLAINRFETLLTYEPEEKLLLPALYNLYLMGRDGFTVAGNESAIAKANQYKSTIISQYPETRYAQILQNPESALNTAGSPEGVYNGIFKQYQQENYAAVIAQTEEQIIRYNGDPIVPKLELLKTYASGRLYGFKAYKEGLDFVALNYPGSEVGKEAALLSEDAEKLQIPETFAPEENSTSFKLLYKVAAADISIQQQAAAHLKENLNAAGAQLTYSIDVYSPETSLVVIHGLNSKQQAQQVETYLADSTNKFTELKTAITIATDNYKIIQVYKSLEDYQSQAQ
jgi:hypothetical protein